MTEGAVAIIDALGFKGIWKRHDLNQVLTKLRQQKQNAELDLGLFRQTFPQAEHFHIVPRVQFLSDTIVIGVQIHPFVSLLTPSEKVVPDLAKADDAYANIQRFIALKQCLLTVAVTVADGLAIEPPLAYRGAVSYGDFAMDGEFLIGPAIDEAAENHERADGPFVFLTDSALKVNHLSEEARTSLQSLDATRFEYLNNLLSLDSFQSRCSVPLKEGHFETFVLDPLNTFPPERRALEAKRLIETFGNSPAIKQKLENANALLTHLGHLGDR